MEKKIKKLIITFIVLALWSWIVCIKVEVVVVKPSIENILLSSFYNLEVEIICMSLPVNDA